MTCAEQAPPRVNPLAWQSLRMSEAVKLDDVLDATDRARLATVIDQIATGALGPKDGVAAINELLDHALATSLRQFRAHTEVERLEALQVMSAGFAHEVRNPLNSASLQLDVVERRLRRLPESGHALDPLALARFELARLSRLFDDFLAFAKPAELRTARCDIRALTSQAVELERERAEQAGVALDVAVAPPTVASVDPIKFQQIVHNLVRNAVEASPPSSKVAIDLHWTDERLHLCVRDHGPGIPASVRSRMYEPFFTTKEGGTGLGMSIVHKLVDMHGGSVEIESSSAGTSVDVLFPRARPDLVQHAH